MTIVQIETHTQDAIQRIVKGKSVVADKETWQAIRTDVQSKVNQWRNDGFHSESDYAQSEIDRLDRIHEMVVED